MLDERDDIRSELEDDEDLDAPTRGEARSRRLRAARRERGLRSGDVFLILVVFILILIVVIFQTDVFSLLYNKTAGLLIIVMAVEFLILKSMDRTRVYQMENARLREQKRGDRALVNRSAELLREASEEKFLRDETTRKEWKTRVDVLNEEVREKL